MIADPTLSSYDTGSYTYTGYQTWSAGYKRTMIQVMKDYWEWFNNIISRYRVIHRLERDTSGTRKDRSDKEADPG